MQVGAYLPGAYEDVVETVHAHVLTEKKALHVRATRTFKDQFNIVRKNGEEWLVQMKDSDTYIPDIYEEVLFLLVYFLIYIFGGFRLLWLKRGTVSFNMYKQTPL